MKPTVWVVLAAIVLVGLSAITFTNVKAAPLLTSQTDCVSNGGRWISVPDADNGYCLLPVGNPITLATCANDDEHLEEFYNTGVLVIFNCYQADGGDGNDPSGCQYVLGGSYASTGTGATCTVTHDYIGDCPGQTTIYEYDNLGNLLGFSCSGSASGGGGGGKLGPKNFFKGFVKTDEPGIFNFLQSKNGDFLYDAGTCSGKCILSPNLPVPAAKTLPDDVVAKLYVRMVDGDGEASEGSYIVCFNLGMLTAPIIYRYVGGEWISQVISIGGGKACTSASGDGAFALGGS